MFFLIVTAFGEGGTGLLLLVWPQAPLALLLGVEQPSPEGLVSARIAGAALVALGVACWVGRSDKQSCTLIGLLIGVLIYDVAAAMLLAHAALFMNMLGIALWPAVLLHAALAVWSVVCLWDKRRDGDLGTRAGLKAASGEKKANGT
jgi:hypothetical protein